MYAYHFENATLGYGDDTEIKIGEWIDHIGGPLVICNSGLHASQSLLFAQTFYKHEYLALVEVEEDGMLTQGTLPGLNVSAKVCSARRRTIARIHAASYCIRASRLHLALMRVVFPSPELIAAEEQCECEDQDLRQRVLALAKPGMRVEYEVILRTLAVRMGLPPIPE